MEIIDYNQSLARQKEDFHEKNNEVRENYEKQKVAQEEIHKYRENKQKEAYKNDLASIERSIQKERSLYNQKTEEALAAKDDVFKKRLDSDREGFSALRKSNKRKYDDRLKHISKSYDQTARINKKKSDERNSDLKDQFLKKASENKKRFDEDVALISKRANEKTAASQNKSSDEKQKIVKESSRQLTNFHKAKARERAETSARHSREIEEFRRGVKREKDDLKEHHTLLQNRTLKNSKNKLEDQRNRYNKDSIRTKDAFRSATDKARTEHLQEMTNQRRAFEDQLNFEKRQKVNLRENSNTVGNPDNKTRHLKKNYENRIDSLKNQMSFTARETNAREKKNVDNMHTEMDKLKKDYNARRDDLVSSQYKELTKTRENILDGKNKEILAYQHNLKNERDHGQRMLFEEKANKKEALYGQKLYFDDKLDSSHSNWRETAKKMVQGHAAEKDIIFTGHQKMVHDQRISSNQKRVDDLDIAHKTNALKMKNTKEELGRENKGLAVKLENQVQKNVDEVRELTDFNQQRKIESDRSARFEMAQKNREYEAKMGELRRRFEEELNKSHHQKESEVSFITNRYEEKIRALKRNHKLDMGRKEISAKERYNILLENKKASEDIIRDQYEAKLVRQKRLSQDQLEQANRRAVANAIAAGEKS